MGTLAQAELGMVGAVLLCAIGVGVRARHERLAVSAALLLMLLMVQA
ncbi:hypothetical protein [Streptomyces sp. NPDC018693]